MNDEKRINGIFWHLKGINNCVEMGVYTSLVYKLIVAFHSCISLEVVQIWCSCHLRSKVFSSGSLVRTSTPSAVMTTVCSNWADLGRWNQKKMQLDRAPFLCNAYFKGLIKSTKCYLLSSSDTAVHLSFKILNSVDPSISMGSVNVKQCYRSVLLNCAKSPKSNNNF